jgi:hypothetical protein
MSSPSSQATCTTAPAKAHIRPWLTTDADPLYDTLYINAARCPRIFKRLDASIAHHHIRLSIPARGPCSAREVLLNLSDASLIQ